MFQPARVDVDFFPFKGCGLRVVNCNKFVNGSAQLPDGSEAGSFECTAAENAEPDFNLGEPAGASRGEMKMYPWMSGQPTVLFGFVDVEIV